MKLYQFLDMEPLFLYLSPSFIIEHGLERISLSLLFVSMVPCHARTYVSIQSCSVLLLIMHVGSVSCVRIPHANLIAHVTGGGGSK